MAAVVVYRWLSRPLSRRRGGVIINRPQEEAETQQVILATPPSWYNFGEQEEERRRVPAYLRNVLRNVRAATQDFTAAPVDPSGEVAVSVCAAQLLIRQVWIPAMAQQTCLMCTSLVVDERIPRSRIPIRVSMERYHISSGYFWTLHEICIYPIWGEDVGSPRLCAFHASEFRRGLGAVLLSGIVLPWRLKLQRSRSI